MKQTLLISLFFWGFIASAQTTFKRHNIKSESREVVDPQSASDPYQAVLYNLEAPKPDGNSYQSFLMQQKIKVQQNFPRTTAANTPKQKTNSAQPEYLNGFRIEKTNFLGTDDWLGGIPNDNTLAVSDSGMVLCGINSSIWARDVRADTSPFIDDAVSLRQIGGGGINNNDFDPKLIFDPEWQRFILVYLQNNTPTNSRIKVCFSSSTNPADPWYSYTLPGNPLNNNRWTDFPAISLANNNLILTVNLIIPGVSWQVGFDGSVIWQIDKEAGFNGDSVLNNTLWTDIKYGNKFIRNLHPVQGAAGNAKEAFLLSNRNFDLTNDTIFVLHLTGSINDPAANLSIKTALANPTYGVPPNGRQADTDLNDPTKGLQTNDARVLGAITNGSWIQYVANTRVPNTGFAGIYHGFMTDIYQNPNISGHIISHPTKDYGYPNLAYTGDDNADIETIIAFNHTSPTDFAGVSAIFFGNDSSYSDVLVLKEGENYADRHSDSYERWGDYFGMQRVFAQQKEVWAVGYFANQLKRNVSWLSKLGSPDTNKFRMNIEPENSPLFCNGSLSALASGGYPPYLYSFNNQAPSSNNNYSGFCEGDTVFITSNDSRGNIAHAVYVAPKVAAEEPNAIFPNPTVQQAIAQFTLSEDQQITASLFTEQGQLVDIILDQPALSGKNEMRFSLQSLQSGVYILRINGSKGFVFTQKIVKVGG